jgi:alkylhydroperoxidase/carboxymuconolactone decarboxylase family protein YurZ
MLVALNRPDELRLHLRAAAACGVTRAELRELLLHAALYCGLPAANAAFHLAEAELPPAGAGPGDRGTGDEP